MHIVPIASEHTHTHTPPDIFSSLPNLGPVVKSRYGGQIIVAYSSVCRRSKRICQTTTVSDHLLSLQKQQLQDLLVWCLLLPHQHPQTLLTECNAAARSLPSLSSYLSRNSLEQEESKEDRRRERRSSEGKRRHLANIWRIRYM